MGKVKRNPLWIATPLAIVCLLLYLSDPPQGQFYLLILMGYALMLVLQTVMIVAKRIAPPPVPDYALRDLFERWEHSPDDWILVEFEPFVPLAQARQRANSPTYSQEDRKAAFLTKARLVSLSTPQVAFFFSSEKGYLLASRGDLATLVKRYGRWTIDTWYSLSGAAGRLGLESRSLDGPQFVRVPPY